MSTEAHPETFITLTMGTHALDMFRGDGSTFNSETAINLLDLEEQDDDLFRGDGAFPNPTWQQICLIYKRKLQILLIYPKYTHLTKYTFQQEEMETCNQNFDSNTPNSEVPRFRVFRRDLM